MSTEKDSAKRGMSKLVVIFYILAALMGVMFIYMFIADVMYINNYAASYGMSFGDMWADAIQYILSSSISYLVFGMLLLGMGKAINLLQNSAKTEEDGAGQKTEAKAVNPPEDRVDESSEEPEDAEAELSGEGDETEDKTEEDDSEESEEKAEEAEKTQDAGTDEASGQEAADENSAGGDEEDKADGQNK